MELIEGNYDVAVFGRLPENEVPCPTCVRGHLVRRENPRNKGAFYGCSNWPDRGVSEVWRLASDPAGQAWPLPRLLELPHLRIHAGHRATATESREIGWL